MKGVRLIFGLAIITLLITPGLQASTQPFDEDTVVVDPQATSEDPFEVQTNVPAVVEEIEEIRDDIEEAEEIVEEAVEETEEQAKEIIEHTVKSGESLWVIAQKLLGDGSRYWEIIEANKDKYPSLEKNPDLILSGWELEIPVDQQEAEAPEEQPADEDQEEETIPAVEIDDDDSSSAEEITSLPEFSVKEKIAKLQNAVDSANRRLLSQGKRIAALNPDTIRFLIDNGFMSEEEWMAMNPPAGYTYRIDRLGNIQLVDANNEPLTNQDISEMDAEAAAAAEAQEEEAAEEAENGTDSVVEDETEVVIDEGEDEAQNEDAQASEDETETESITEDEGQQEQAADQQADEDENEQAVEEEEDEDAAAQEEEIKQAANERYAKMLSEIGMPDVSENKDYYKAIRNGSKLLSEGFFGGTTEFLVFVRAQDYPQYNIKGLQKELKTLQTRYEKQVKEGKTDRFLGIFGSTIKSTGKRIQQVKEKLEKAWKKMETALEKSEEKADELNQKIDKQNETISQLQAELDDMDIYDADNSSEVQQKMKGIKDAEKEIEKANKKLDNYKELTKVFDV
ncbi:MAG: LysM peptidoglycan-binding domain-containing protein [Candidatus Rifleibacteriota bacterium]